MTVIDSDKPEYALPRAHYKRWPSAVVKAGKVRGTYVFREAIKEKQ